MDLFYKILHIALFVMINIYCRQKVNHEYSEQFLHVFQQWDADIQKAEEQEEKLTVCFLFY